MDSRKGSRKKKGISTFIATLLLIVLVVAAGVLIYAYTMGYLGNFNVNTKTGTLQVQSVAESDGELHIYAKNIGGGDVSLDPNSIYLNDIPLVPDTDFSTNLSGNDIAEGVTVDIMIHLGQIPDTLNGLTSTIKIVTVGGGFATTSYKITDATGGGVGNDPPTAGFTFTTVGLTATFTDTSTDSDGSIVSWDWNFGDTQTSTAQNPSHTYASAGTYTVTLTVKDNGASTDPVSHSVIVSLSNVDPTAGFTFTTEGLTATFTDASTDSDGTVESWAWAFGDGATSTAQNPSHTYASADTYTVTLTVTDDDGASSTPASQDVTVSPLNVAPTADFTYVATGLDVTFTDASTDSDGSIVSWGWNFGDTQTSTAQNPSHTYASADTYTVTLTVTDDDGASSTPASQDVTVSLLNVAPSAAFSFTPTGLSVQFTDESTDSDGTVDSWSWNFGDGGTSTSQNPSHTYASANTYTVTLIVTDNDGAPSTQASQSVTVSENNVAPILASIGDKNVNELASLSFTATATDANLPAQTLTFSIQGTNYGATINSGTGAFSWTPTEAQGPNTYSITIRVTDNGSPAMYGEETIIVTVAEVNAAPVLASIGPKSVNEGATLTFTASATDSDVPAQTLTYSLQGTVPTGAAITAGGVFTWTPDSTQGQVTPYSITVRVTDNGALFAEETIQVTVVDVPQQVTYVSAGTGSGSTNGNPTPTYPGSLQANDLILLQITVRGDSTPTITPPTGFGLLRGPDASGGSGFSGDERVTQWIYYKFSTGSESGTGTVTITGTNYDRAARMYAFRNVALTSFTEGAGSLVGNDDVVLAQPVTTTGTNRLAVTFVSLNNDGISNVIPFTGGSGGTWTEPVGQFEFNGDDDITMQLQTATMASAGTIQNGSYDTGTTNYRWVVTAFALKP